MFVVTNKLWIVWKETSYPSWSRLREFVWKAYENHQKLIIVGFRDDNRTRHVPDTCLERYPYSNTMNLAKSQTKQRDRYTLIDSVRNKVWSFLSNESVKVELSLNCLCHSIMQGVQKYEMNITSLRKSFFHVRISLKIIGNFTPKNPWLKNVSRNATDGSHKGKVIPVQNWTGRKSSRRMRLPDFKAISTWRW
jgi:hypothetical protein